MNASHLVTGVHFHTPKCTAVVLRHGLRENMCRETMLVLNDHNCFFYSSSTLLFCIRVERLLKIYLFSSFLFSSLLSSLSRHVSSLVSFSSSLSLVMYHFL
jgi:hypothetical protein